MLRESRTDSSTPSSSSSSIIGVVNSENVFADPNFDPVKYTNDAFTSRTLPEARAFVKELDTEKEVTSTKMTRKVLQNYKTLIEASKEVTVMEGGFSQLRGHLNEIQELIGELKETAIGIEQRNSQEAARAIRASSSAGGTKQSRENVQTAQLAKEVNSLLDIVGQLDLLLPLRKFPEAVDAIEVAQKILSANPQLAAVDQLRKPLEERTARLCTVLLADLKAPRQLSSPAANIALLVRLQCADKAREVFLQRASESLRASIKEVREHGSDAVQYTQSLSALLFSKFQSTLAQLQEAFGGNNNPTQPSASAANKVVDLASKSNHASFVVWALNELDDLLETHLRTQLFQRTEDFDLLVKCVQILRTSAKPLEEKGVALTFHLDAALRADLLAALRSHMDRVQNSVSQSVDEEQWISKTQYTYKLDLDANVDQKRGGRTELQLTDSAQLVYSSAQKLISASSEVLISLGAVSDVIAALENLVQQYIARLLSILGNTASISTTPSSSSSAVVTTPLSLLGAYNNQNLNLSLLSLNTTGSTALPAARSLLRSTNQQPTSEAQLLAVLLNVSTLVEDLLPHARMQLENRTKQFDWLFILICLRCQSRAGYLLPEFNDLLSRVNANFTELQICFAKKRAEQIVVDKMDWEHIDYSNNNPPTTTEPTSKFQKLSEFVPSMVSSLRQSLGQEVSLAIGKRFVEEILDRMGNANWWTRNPSPVSPSGAKQLVSDLKFLQQSLSASPLLSARSKDLFAQLCTRAVAIHSAKTK